MIKHIEEEFPVYRRMLNYLQGTGWKIVCASPPAGTDNRYRKCLLPRRDLSGSQKGPRDEVDITAHDEQIILIIECKPMLSQSFTHLNALSESDYDKLKRIEASFSPTEIAELLKRGTGIYVPSVPTIGLALAVGKIDFPIPDDMTVFEVTEEGVRIFPAPNLYDRFNP